MPDHPRPRRMFDPVALAVAVGLAALVWLYVDGRRTDSKEITIPFSVSAPDGWELTGPTDPPEEIAVQLQGPRLQIENISPVDLAVEKRLAAPAADIDQSGATVTVDGEDIPTPPGVYAVAIRPDRIDTTMERLVPKYIRVEVKTVGEPAPGYRVVRTEADPTTVKITAPKGSANFGDTVETYNVAIDGASSSVYKVVGVRPVEIGGRMRSSDTDVYVSVIIEPIPKKRVFEKQQVRVMYNPFRDPRIARIDPPAVRVEVEGPVAAVDALGDHGPAVFVDMAELTGEATGEHTLEVHVEESRDISTTTVEPESVTVTLRKEE